MTTEFQSPRALLRVRPRTGRYPRVPGATAGGPRSVTPTATAAVVPSHGAAAPHWRALDGLRGVAVAGVVAYHLGWISGGFLGVDLFFALSGFLITSLLLREHDHDGRIDVVAFWGRRFRRLLPAVMALIVAVLAWCAVWGTPAEQAGARTDARWAIPYLANWHLVAESRDYWSAVTESSVFVHLWSLAIEEQFYVVWPVLVWWVLRSPVHGRRRLGAVVAVGALASTVAMVVLAVTDTASRVYFGTDTRAVALLLGAAVALRYARNDTVGDGRARRGARIDAVVAVLAVALAVSWVVGGDHLDVLVHGGLAVHSLAAAVLVGLLARSSDRGGRSAAVLDRRWLVWLGQRSYGIYLWHWPVIVLAEPRWTALSPWVRDVAVIAVSLALAEASFRLLEHPVRRRSGWAAGRRASVATTVVTVAAVVAVVVAPSGRGHVAAFDVATVSPAAPVSPAATVSSGAPAGPAPTGETGTTGVTVVTGDDAATSGGAAPVPEPSVGSGTSAGTASGSAAGAPAPSTAPSAPRHRVGNVLWIGDSVADDLAPAIGAAFEAAGLRVTDGADAGRRLVPGGGVDPVEIVGELLGADAFDTVVLQMSFWDSPATHDELLFAYTWLRDQVVARGATLVVVTPPPVRDDLADAGLARQIEVARRLAADPSGAVHLVDASALWGTSMVADLEGDGSPDRKPDGVHVCPQGAAKFAAWFVGELAARFDGVAPAPVDTWAGGPWAADDRYDTLAGACTALG